jgi:hypothetical protein
VAAAGARILHSRIIAIRPIFDHDLPTRPAGLGR